MQNRHIFNLRNWTNYDEPGVKSEKTMKKRVLLIA